MKSSSPRRNGSTKSHGNLHFSSLRHLFDATPKFEIHRTTLRFGLHDGARVSPKHRKQLFGGAAPRPVHLHLQGVKEEAVVTKTRTPSTGSPTGIGRIFAKFRKSS